MCRLECPANVDIPKLMVEAKATYLATNGEAIHSWFMTHIDQLCRYGSRYQRVSNWVVGNHAARWVVEKLLGISRSRKLPHFRSQPYVQTAAQRQLDRSVSGSGEKVLYFVDTYANYCDAQLAEAFVAVLEHNGIPVYVPSRQQQAAMPAISNGNVPLARRVAETNVPLLAEAVRNGYTIVSTEPSAVLALTHEYLQLLPGDQDAAMVSLHTFEACHYLWRLHQEGRLGLKFEKLEASFGYHTPCHVKALEIGTPALNLLGLIPGIQIERIEKGCSGIAGMYGFRRDHYRNSLRAGLPLISAMRTGNFTAGTTERSILNPNGAKHIEADVAPGEDFGPCLRFDAGTAGTAGKPWSGSGGHMKISVKMFAAAREAVGSPEASVELALPAAISDLRAALAEKYPAELG